jgi:hypothetical protein
MWRTFAAALAAAVVLSVSGVPAAGASAPHTLPPLGNLLVNSDAETGICTRSGYDGMTVPGWTVTRGAADSVCFGAIGFPRPDVDGPIDRGRAFFSGGGTGDASMFQNVDLSGAAGAIDGGAVVFALAGWLGGWANQNDRSDVAVAFHNDIGVTLGTAALDPVTNTDRAGVTGFTQRTDAGAIPPGTRWASVTVSFTWTAGDTTDGYVDDLTFGVDAPLPAPKLVVPESNVPGFDHVFFVFMENQNESKDEAPVGRGDYIVGNPAAPYLNKTLAPQGSLLTQMYATTHPSDPNYLAVTGGDTFGWATNPVIGTDPIDAPHLGDRLDEAGLGWKGYADGAFGNCDTTYHNNAAGGWYLPDDQPFMHYKDVVTDRGRCIAHNQPLTALPVDLMSADTTPAFVWFAANDMDSMEDGGVAAGDAWLSRTLPQIFRSPAWTGQRSLLIVSWDEGRAKAYGPDYPNHVAAYVLGSQGTVKSAYSSTVRYTDYSLGRTIEDALGLRPLTSNDRYAVPLGDVWTTKGDGSGGPGGSNM